MQNIKANPTNYPADHFPTPPTSWISFLDAIARRTLDIIAAFIGLLFLSPVFAVVAWVIHRDSPGPVFYRGPRIGKHGRCFNILKFRTMYERPDCYEGPRITGASDNRITALGHWLRDTKVNELPQLWNVLIGDMTLVGPRPEDPEIAENWPAEMRRDMLSVRPGITSPATVVFRGEERILASDNILDDYLGSVLPDKLRLDLLYLRRRSLLTDLDVIFMTLVMLLPRIRNAHIPETLLYWGPLAQFVSRFFNWFCIDTLVALGGIGLAGLIWRMDQPLNFGFQFALIIAFAISLSFSITNAILGVNRVQWRRATTADVIPLIFSSVLVALTLILVNVFFFNRYLTWVLAPMPSGLLLLASGFACFGFIAARYRERLLTGFATYWLRARRAQSTIGERIIIIGCGENSQLATWLLTRSRLASVFTVIGIVDDDPRMQNLIVEGFPVIGTTRDISNLVERHDVGLLLYTISNICESERERVLQTCHTTRANLVILPDIMAEISAHFQFPTSIPSFEVGIKTTAD